MWNVEATWSNCCDNVVLGRVKIFGCTKYFSLKLDPNFASSQPVFTKQTLKVKHTDPSVNSKEGNPDEEPIEIGEQVPLVGEDGGEEAVEEEDEGGDAHCREERKKTSDDRARSHSNANSTKPCCYMIQKGSLCSPIRINDSTGHFL